MEINEEKITAIGVNAFKDANLTNVVIPSEIISIGSNAFANNNLETVIIKEKYDSSNFEFYGDNVFGNFNNIIYDNELTRMLNYIDNNFMNPISVEAIAREHNMDRTYLSKLFKKKYGKSLKEYIIYTRLKEARLLLTNGKNVTEAALFCGFNSPAHFSRIYKKYYMDPPVAHKESNYVDRIERK